MLENQVTLFAFWLSHHITPQRLAEVFRDRNGLMDWEAQQLFQLVAYAVEWGKNLQDSDNK
ncbi:MAG: hypothetical protein KGL39_00170 [Patescibacteria group bacterium]|nr:hypothetical protein [Patescibacteria group bacterium]